MYTSRLTLPKPTIVLSLGVVLLLALSACTLPQAVVVPNEDGQQEAVVPTEESQEEATAIEAAESTTDSAATEDADTENADAEMADAEMAEDSADSDSEEMDAEDSDSADGSETAATSIIAAVSVTTVPEEEPEEESAESMDSEEMDSEEMDSESMDVEDDSDNMAEESDALEEDAPEEDAAEGGERSVITVGDLLGSDAGDSDTADAEAMDSDTEDSDTEESDGEATVTVGDIAASDDSMAESAEDEADESAAAATLTVGDILASGQGTSTTATENAATETASTNAAPTTAAPSAPVATAVPVYYIEIDSGTNNLNVRAEPDSSAEIVDKLPSGTIVQYFPSESQGEWYKIPQGWVSASFTKAARIDSQRATAPGGGTAGSTASNANRVFGLQNSDSPYVVTALENISLRSGPNDVFPAVATATPGRAYEIQGIDRTREWYQVLVPGVNDLVWIAAADVDAIGALNDIPIRSGPSSGSSESPAAGDSNRFVRVPPPTSDPPSANSTLNSSALASALSTPTPTLLPPTPVPPTLLPPTPVLPTPVPTQISQPLPTQPPPPTPTLTAEQAAYYANLAASQSSPAGPQAPAQPPAQPPAQAQSYPAAPGFFGYGVQAHMLGGGIGQAVNATSEMGFNWIKQQVQWREFEGSPGALDFSELRRIVDQAGSRNISVLFSVVNAPDWAREPGFDGSVGGPPADPQTMATFVGRLAADFCGSSLKAIEVWNEQNLHYEWGNKPLNPAEYMNLLRASYASIKNACPSMIVVSGALTPAGPNGNFAMDDFQYLEMMYQNGLVSYADAIGAHPSGYNVPPNITWDQACAAIQQTGNQFNGACDNPHHSWSFRSTMEGYRNIMQVYGDAGKRIWPTEFGWAADGAFDPRYAYANDNSLEEQKNWTVEAYRMMKNWGWVGPAFLWNLNFRVVANGTEKAQWGIVRNDYSPLPVYNALRAMPK